ncbi:MAG: hypothetical protein HFG88_01950 [Dorea sp.]|nr:hypothetical protein [Dorea sp.]
MVIRYKKLENKYENKLALYINLMMIIDIIRRCFNLFDLTFVYDTEVQAILYIYLFTSMFIRKYQDSKKLLNVIIAGLLSVGLFLYGLIMEPQVSSIFVISLLNYFTLVFGTCILVKEIKNTKVFIDCSTKYIYFCLLYSVVVILTQSKQVFSPYSMTFSFNCFFPLGLSLILGFFGKKRINIAYAIIILAVNMAIGSRSIVIYTVMIVGGIYLYLSRNKYYVLKLILGIFTIYFVFDYKKITSWVGTYLLQFFPTSRTIELLSNGKIFVLSGREVYFDIIEKSLKNNPFAIHGLLTDRIIIGNSIGHTTYITEYPHNIFLEVFYQHGIILGLLFFIVLLLIVVKSIIVAIKQRDGGKWDIALFIIVVSFAVSQLLVSNSYIISISFGLLIGTSLCLINHGKEWSF